MRTSGPGACSRFNRPLALVTALAAATTLLVACSTSGGSGSVPESSSASGSGELTVYSGQHEALVQALAAAYKKATGETIKIRSGDDAELANQIIEEGDKSPADIFLSEEPGPVGMLAGKHLLAAVDKSSLAEVDKRLVPSSGDWLPYAARVRVVYYDPDKIAPSALPHSILDLTQPQWKGKFAYAPSGAFISTVSYLIHSIGADKTEQWLKGIKANGVNEQSNGKVRDTIEAGRLAFGLSNHYYWWILAQSKGGPDKLQSKIYYFDHADAGGLILASGAAILKSSTHQQQAQKFLAWIGSTSGGQQIVATNEDAQYPVAPGVTSKAGLQPLSQIVAPDVDQSVFADTTEAQKLVVEAGIS